KPITCTSITCLGDGCGLAAIGLEQSELGPWGRLISPATWAYNWATEGTFPSSVDVGYWGVGMAGGLFGPVTLAASYVKAFVDDDLARKVAEVRRTEAHSPYARGIMAITGWGPPSASAMDFAYAGGTAWQHPDGAWVTVVDDRKRMIANYHPRAFVSIRRPVWPLQPIPGRKGKYVFSDKTTAPPPGKHHMLAPNERDSA
ncbi:MAG: hypothetical protein OXU20_21780, partial [Myxococcales bacterium]|nr:hypothetical protein [Myxococcales bacterium]